MKLFIYLSMLVVTVTALAEPKKEVEEAPKPKIVREINSMTMITQVKKGGLIKSVAKITASYYPEISAKKQVEGQVEGQAVKEEFGVILASDKKGIKLSHSGAEPRRAFTIWQKYFGEWAGKLDTGKIEFSYPEDALARDGNSSWLPYYLLLRAVFEEVEFNETAAVTGEITAQGYLKPVPEIHHKIPRAVTSEMKWAVIPLENEKDLIKHVLLQGPEILTSIEIYGLAKADEVFELIKKKNAKKSEAVTELFARLAAGLKDKGWDNGKEFLPLCDQILSKAPGHLSTKLAKAYIQNELPVELSKEESMEQIIECFERFIMMTSHRSNVRFRDMSDVHEYGTLAELKRDLSLRYRRKAYDKEAKKGQDLSLSIVSACKGYLKVKFKKDIESAKVAKQQAVIDALMTKLTAEVAAPDTPYMKKAARKVKELEGKLKSRQRKIDSLKKTIDALIEKLKKLYERIEELTNKRAGRGVDKLKEKVKKETAILKRYNLELEEETKKYVLVKRLQEKYEASLQGRSYSPEGEIELSTEQKKRGVMRKLETSFNRPLKTLWKPIQDDISVLVAEIEKYVKTPELLQRRVFFLR